MEFCGWMEREDYCGKLTSSYQAKCDDGLQGEASQLTSVSDKDDDVEAFKRTLQNRLS